MADHEFESLAVEEFYNSCHSRADGRFCGRGAKGKSVVRVPMSEGARRSNAILRRLAADRKSKDYSTAKKNASGSWANREKGQGGLRGVSGSNSKKADAARAANAKAGAKTTARKKLIKKESNTIKYKNTDNKGNETRTSEEALRLTRKYGGRG